jgi:hypothetical protein
MWISIEESKRKWRDYKVNKVFQNVWSAKLPWVKSVVDAHARWIK